MKKIFFIDGIGGPYDGKTRDSTAKIGGTEVTIIRVAELLAEHYQVYVLQQGLFQQRCVNAVTYMPLHEKNIINPDKIIIIRPRRLIRSIARRYSYSEIYYWMHDIPNHRLWKYKHLLQLYDCKIIAISNYQHELIQKAWCGRWYHRIIDLFLRGQNPKIKVIYNPVDEALQPDTTEIIPTKLLFFSAPDRGLEEILLHFQSVKQHLPQLELFIAYPGYSCLDDYDHLLQQPGITILGSLSHQEIIQHVREAFCIFYPQQQKPECFGLVYAEANAVGTPVLAHDFGAAREILQEKSQLIDANDISSILSTLNNWVQNRPRVFLDNKFRPQQILKSWDQEIIKS